MIVGDQFGGRRKGMSAPRSFKKLNGSVCIYL